MIASPMTTLPERGVSYRATLRNGVLTYVQEGQPDLALSLTVPTALGALAVGAVDPAVTEGMTAIGEEMQLHQLLAIPDPGDPAFNIIEPRRHARSPLGQPPADATPPVSRRAPRGSADEVAQLAVIEPGPMSAR
jgi:Alkyl sulfatase C-terminal